jgi:spermidine/putrescine transport system ATP-binding protein
MQIELKKIQKKLGLTFIYVTHDQDEALTMSDRIVIINDGVIIQDDTPQNIYLHPSDVFAADFIGESNILGAEIISIKNKETIISVFGNEYSIPNVESDEVGKKIKILIRPENIKVVTKKEGNVFGIVKEIVYDGAVTKYFITTNKGVNLRVNVMGNYRLEESDNICLKVTNNDLFPLRRDNNA